MMKNYTHVEHISDVWCFTHLVYACNPFIQCNSTIFTEAVQQRVNLSNSGYQAQNYIGQCFGCTVSISYQNMQCFTQSFIELLV